MKKSTLLLAFLILGLVALAFAAPDFSGTWAFNKDKSDPMRGPGGQAADVSITLVIKQTANDITITRKMTMGDQERSSDQKFTLDGKECTNPALMGRGEFKAAAKLEGETLVIEGTQTTQRGEVKLKDQYALSDGGKVLTYTSTRATPQGDRTQKQVFDKK